MTVRTIDLGYSPRPWQIRLHTGRKRFNLAIVHRRGGKSYAAKFELIDCALKLAGGHFAYIAPTLVQARRVMWTQLRETSLLIPHTEVREQDMTVHFANGAVIRCLGADSADGIRGLGFDGVVADEFQLWSREVMPLIVLPTLAGRNGWLLEIGTPTGIDALTIDYDKHKNDPEWACWLFPVSETGVLTDDEIRLQRANMLQSQFDVEFMCRFDAGSPNQLISGDAVAASMKLSYEPRNYEDAPRIIGCDVARQGNDFTTLVRRQGHQCWEHEAWHAADLNVTAKRIAEAYYAYKADALFVDGGGVGAGAVDILRSMGIPVIEIQFGGKASDPRFANMRAEMYNSLALWIMRGGRLPMSPDLKIELTATTYHQNDKGQLQMDDKDTIRERIGRSPDIADAVALTFAMPVHKQTEKDYIPAKNDWDPFAG